MPTQHFLIEGRYLGSVERDPKHRPQSYAFLCKTCAEVWARAPIEGVPYIIWGDHPCRKHTWGAVDVPGSLMLRGDPVFNSLLPPEVLLWEFHRHLEAFESSHQ